MSQLKRDALQAKKCAWSQETHFLGKGEQPKKRAGFSPEPEGFEQKKKKKLLKKTSSLLLTTLYNLLRVP